jgi:hypothetical protein
LVQFSSADWVKAGLRDGEIFPYRGGIPGPALFRTRLQFLITGATSGTGKATAFGLAAMGAQLTITGRDRLPGHADVMFNHELARSFG